MSNKHDKATNSSGSSSGDVAPLSETAGTAQDAVAVDKTDMALIIQGIQQMPAAISQMTEAIQTLADTGRRVPTRSAQFFIGFVLTSLLVASQAWQAQTIRSTQAETQQIAQSIYDCLDYTESGNPNGACAREVSLLLKDYSDSLSEKFRCQIEVRFFSFFANNPQLEVSPSISPECEEILQDFVDTRPSN